jgi:hypothetical protein
MKLLVPAREDLLQWWISAVKVVLFGRRQYCTRLQVEQKSV